MIGIDDEAVRAGEMAVARRRDMLHRDSIIDVAADHVEIAGPYRDDDVAMRWKAANRQIVVGNGVPSAPIADQIAALRSIDLDPLGGQRSVRFEAETMASRRVDVVRMGF